MTVVNPKSISGINSITTGSGSDNLLTIHTSDASSTERVRINSSGDVIVGSGITVSPDGDIFATGVTTSTTFVGALTGNVTGNISGGTVAGSTGTFTGDVDIADKIIHTGDTNTAIRFPAVDKVTVETSGTERLAIEPAGNVNAPKSVNVGIGLTVGVGSTSTFIGGGSLELTKSDGSAHIDFKNAFADDYDARIITSGGNQLQFFTGGQGATLCALQTSTAKVAIATDVSPSIAKLEIHSDKLGATAGDTQELLLLKSPDISNSTTYRFTNYRKSNGNTHVTSELRFRRHVDVTDMGYFGLGDGYASIGYATAEKARFPSTGGITFNGDTATANALDDYEEGTWTPVIKNGGGTITTIHGAKYTKVGRLVHIQTYFNYTTANDSGAFQIQGLPFNNANQAYSPQVVDFGRGGKKGAYSRVHPGSDYAEFLYSSESTSSDRITIKGNMIGTGYIIFSNTYQSA